MNTDSEIKHSWIRARAIKRLWIRTQDRIIIQPRVQSYIDKHGRMSTRRWNENLNFESYHKISRTETGERKVFKCTKNNFNFLCVACDENYCIKDEKECMMRKIVWKVKEITLIRRDCRAKEKMYCTENNLNLLRKTKLVMDRVDAAIYVWFVVPQT